MARVETPDAAEVEPLGAAWAETQDRFPRDRWLRDHGFTLTFRPRYGPVIWRRKGRYYNQSQAEEAALKDQAHGR
jgi:hypothetical protein